MLVEHLHFEGGRLGFFGFLRPSWSNLLRWVKDNHSQFAVFGLDLEDAPAYWPTQTLNCVRIVAAMFAMADRLMGAPGDEVQELLLPYRDIPASVEDGWNI